MMQIRTLILVFLNLSVLSTFGNDHKILYGVFYEFKHVMDEEKPNDTLVDQTLLLLSAQSSRFMSYSKLEYGVTTHKQYESFVRFADKTKPFQYRIPSTIQCFLPEHYMVFYPTRIHRVMDYPGKSYLYQTDFPKIEWKLQEQFKQILGLSSQLAIATYKGRKWEAWFTHDIPLSAGPWELVGLPGLILEAYDQSREVQFNAKAVLPYAELANDEVLSYYSKDRIELPRAFIDHVSRTEFEKIVDLATKDWRAFASSPSATYGQNAPMYLNVFNMLWKRNQFANPLDKSGLSH